MRRGTYTRSLGALMLCAATSLAFMPACKVKVVEPPKVAAVPKPPLPTWRVASAYLEDIFAQIPNSSIDDFRRDIPEAERKAVNESHGGADPKSSNAYVYGEPTPVTSDLMLKGLDVHENDVLYDLGCGRGFFLMQALMTTPIKKAVGVELAKSRVDIGKIAQGMMVDQGLLKDGKVLELREQDMTQTDLSDATLVYMDSVFFSDELLMTVAKNMAKAKNMRKVVMIMKGLPPNPWFELERTEKLKMSWSPRFGSDVLYYKRTATPAE